MKEILVDSHLWPLVFAAREESVDSLGGTLASKEVGRACLDVEKAEEGMKEGREGRTAAVDTGGSSEEQRVELKPQEEVALMWGSSAEVEEGKDGLGLISVEVSAHEEFDLIDLVALFVTLMEEVKVLPLVLAGIHEALWNLLWL